MELIIERIETARDCKYMQDIECTPLIIRESGGLDYGSAAGCFEILEKGKRPHRLREKHCLLLFDFSSVISMLKNRDV